MPRNEYEWDSENPCLSLTYDLGYDEAEELRRDAENAAQWDAYWESREG